MGVRPGQSFRHGGGANVVGLAIAHVVAMLMCMMKQALFLLSAMAIVGCSRDAYDQPQHLQPPPPHQPSHQPTEKRPPNVLFQDGLGALRIGLPVPPATSWIVASAQTGDACTTLTSSEYPGVYAILSNGKVQRITVGQRSEVKLEDGTAIGAAEADVSARYQGFVSEPHKYVAAPAKYLTAPNPQGPAFRFEIGEDGKVSLIHAGVMPVLAYVEGCS